MRNSFRCGLFLAAVLTARALASPAPSPPLLPDPKLTPGDVLPVTVADICTPGYTKRIRSVPAAVKAAVYKEYGIKSHKAGDFEIDHLVSLELGGSNSIKNLWPQSFRAQPWNAHIKDALEDHLHFLVCRGQLPLATAQSEIRSNWVLAYQKYFHTALPLPPHQAHPNVQ